MKILYIFLIYLFTANTIFTATITSAQNGRWDLSSTWLGGVKPGASDDAIINHNVSIEIPTIEAGSVTVNPGGTLVLTTSGFLIISPAGFITNNGTISIDPVATVQFKGSAAVTGNIIFADLHLLGAGSIDLGAGSTINKSLMIMHPEAVLVNNSPEYGPDSDLMYNVAGLYTAGLEWVPGQNGAGVPHGVNIGYGTTLSLSGSSSRYVAYASIDEDAELQLSTTAGGDLYLTGFGIANAGTLTSNGRKVIFYGNELQTIDSWGDVPSVFENVEINNESGVTLADNDIQINNSLVFTAGKLFTTTNYKVILAGSASVIESAGNNIEGKVESSKAVGTGGIVNWAGLGATISAGVDDVGTVTLTRITGTDAIQTFEGKSGIACVWAFGVPVGVPNGRNVSFNWLPDYDNSKLLTSMRIWVTPNGGTNWFDINGVNQNASSRSISGTYAYGLAGTGVFTISDVSNPLPVELTSFTANAAEGKVKLNWSTATEVNNYGFEVQRLSVIENNPHWEVVGFVEGSGNSNSPKLYSFVDSNPPEGNLQYRLKQIDNDGQSEYYSTIAEVNFSITGVVEKQLPTEFGLSQNYPNPFNPETVISFQLSVFSHATLKVYDLLGNEVAELVNENKQPGYYSVKLDGSNLSTGVYIYRLTAGSFTSTKKLMLVK